MKTHLHSVEIVESHVLQESTSRRPAAIKVTRIWDARNVCKSVRQDLSSRVRAMGPDYLTQQGAEIARQAAHRGR